MVKVKNINSISEDDCIAFIKESNDPTINKPLNPLSSIRINKDGDKYNEIHNKCRKKFPHLYENKASKDEGGPSRKPLPKKIGNVLVAQNLKQWNNQRYTDYKYIYEIMITAKIITEVDYANFEDFVKVLNALLEHDIIPKDEIEYVEKMRDDFENYKDADFDTDLDNRARFRVNFVTKQTEKEVRNIYEKCTENTSFHSYYNQPHPRSVRRVQGGVNNAISCLSEYYSNRIKKTIETIIDNGMSQDLKNTVKNLLDSRVFLDYLIFMDILGPEYPEITIDDVRNISDMEYNISFTLLKNFVKEIGDYEIEKKKNYSIEGDTKSRSLPKSISRERKRIKIRKAPYQIDVPDEENIGQMKKKTIIPGVNAPEEYNERSFSEELVSTGRSKFKSHSKLSKMTAMPEEIEQDILEEKIEKLPNKKRTQILQELRNACIEMRDGITNKRFDRMVKKNLQLVISLGDKNAEGKQKCFYVRGLYKTWMDSIRNNDIKINVPNSYTEITQAEKDEIMRKMKYVDKKAPNPDELKMKKDPNLILEFQPTFDPNFEKIVIKRVYGDYVVTLYNLCLIPTNIEMGDLKDYGLTETASADHTSAVLKLYIQALFDNGGLMQSNFLPYSCCKIHLGQDKDYHYWTEDVSGNKYKDGVNLNKFLHMFNEIKPRITAGILRGLGM